MKTAEIWYVGHGSRNYLHSVTFRFLWLYFVLFQYQDLRSSAGRSPAALLARGTGTRGASQTYDELEEDLDVGRFDEVPGELSDANSMSSGYR